MQKNGLIPILLILALPLSASPSWLGVQRVGWQSYQEATATYMGESFTSSGPNDGVGIIIAGSLYPEQQRPYGLGFQFGATKELPSDSSETPLAWRGVITSQYGSNISESVTLEFGTGLLYERLTDAYTSGGSEKDITVKSFSFYSSLNLIITFAQYLSLIGGVSMAIPLYNSAEVTSGGITTKPDIYVTGYSFETQIGLALAL